MVVLVASLLSCPAEYVVRQIRIGLGTQRRHHVGVREAWFQILDPRLELGFEGSPGSDPGRGRV